MPSQKKNCKSCMIFGKTEETLPHPQVLVWPFQQISKIFKGTIIGFEEDF